MNLYHYTSGEQILKIIDSRCIKQATSFIGKDEKPVVWFSTNEKWEHTATKCVGYNNGEIRSLTFEEQAKLYGCARIQITSSNKLYNWRKLAKVANINRDTVQALEASALRMGGNPNEWYGSLEPIGVEYWVKCEFYLNGEWVDCKIFGE